MEKRMKKDHKKRKSHFIMDTEVGFVGDRT